MQVTKAEDLSSIEDLDALPVPSEMDFETHPVAFQPLEVTFGKEATNNILRSFILHMDRILLLIEESMEREDRVTVCDLFHQIKGMSSGVYASDLSRTAYELEKQTKEEPVCWSDVKEGLAKLRRLNMEATNYIKQTAKV